MKTLKASEKPKVSYCIPLWLRDDQIRHAISVVPDRVQPGETRTEPIAVVCFGPSLNETWEKIKDFKYVITCSGAHKFLVDRGIIPTWHVEVDPREHKVELIGQPQKETEYLIASTCHPKIFEHLKDYKVRLWHVFDTEADGMRVLPRGEWCITGGCDAGLRCISLAAFLGFKDVHIFGKDGSEGKTGKHADKHPNQPKKSHRIEYPEGSGIWYNTTPSMLAAAQQTFHELNQLPKLKATFYGDGLVQAMAKDYKPKPVTNGFENMTGISHPKLISDEYKELNSKLHKDNLLYGTSGHKHVDTIIKLVQTTQSGSVLDYGCGKGTLAKNLPFPIWEYDPAIPEKSESPRVSDLVVCTDVLEHIEPENLMFVLDDLRRVLNKVGYFVINTGPAMKTLADGRNAHLIQKPKEWWQAKLEKFFDIGKIFETGPELYVVVGPKTQKKIEPVTKVEKDGIEAFFHTPNEVTSWRVNTLFTKEPITMDWINTFREGEVFYDIGANMGGYSIWAGKKKAKVFAFEPESSNYSLLCQNMTRNGIDGSAYCIALTDKPKLSHIYLSAQQAGGSCHSFDEKIGPDLQERDGIAQGCVGMRLDDLNLPSPDHIKIDVDGLEHKVILGARKTLKKVKSLLVEINTNLPEHLKMIEILDELGFTFDKSQAESALRQSGPFKGCGEYVFYKRDPVEEYVLEKIRSAKIKKAPYRHLYIEDVFPKDFYEQMMGDIPEDGYEPLETARNTKGYPQRFVKDAPESVHWMRNGRLRRLLDEKFGVKSVSDEVIIMQDKPGYSISPHTDSPGKVATCLFYVTKNWTEKEHGTSIYVPKDKNLTDTNGYHFDRKHFRKVWTAPGKPNSVFIFPRANNSFHGAEPYKGKGSRNILLFDTRSG